jgi:chromosome segregation ATPase
LEFGGVSSTQNGWVEPGNQKSKIDQLERDLGNRSSELDDERGKVKSLTERLQHVRKELNEERSNHISARRAVDELQARHNQKTQALEARLQQEIDQRHRDAAHFQGQIQYHIQHTQQLQANLESAAATAAESQQRLAQQPDPSALYPELEQLRQYKIQSDTETSNLRNQLSHKQNEINTLQTKLNESSSRAGEVEGAKVELQKAKENAKSLQDKCDRLEKRSAENDNQRKSESDKTTELDRKLEVSLILSQIIITI